MPVSRYENVPCKKRTALLKNVAEVLESEAFVARGKYSSKVEGILLDQKKSHGGLYREETE